MANVVILDTREQDVTNEIVGFLAEHNHSPLFVCRFGQSYFDQVLTNRYFKDQPMSDVTENYESAYSNRFAHGFLFSCDAFVLFTTRKVIIGTKDSKCYMSFLKLALRFKNLKRGVQIC